MVQMAKLTAATTPVRREATSAPMPKGAVHAGLISVHFEMLSCSLLREVNWVTVWGENEQNFVRKIDCVHTVCQERTNNLFRHTLFQAPSMIGSEQTCQEIFRVIPLLGGDSLSFSLRNEMMTIHSNTWK